MGGQDRQGVKAHAAHDVVKTIEGKFEAAKGVLDGDLPRRDGTDKDLIFRCCQYCTRLRVEPGRLGDRPDEDVRVEQQVQGVCPSNASFMASGSGSSKSGPSSTS